MTATRTLLVVLLGGLTALGLAFDGDVLAAGLVVALGWLALSRFADADRIRALEERAGALERRLGSGPPPEVAASVVPATDVPEVSVPSVPAEAPAPQPSLARPTLRPPRVPRPPRAPRRSLLDDLPPPVRQAWAFVTGGNPVARVGLLVLFVGIGLGIRYAVDSGWLSVEIRLAFAALAGAALVAVGWRLRRGTPGFGLTLQGGGVAVLYLTIYAAYALYGLVPSLLAIVLMGAVSVLCGALALVQNAPGLAVLGVAGGFAAPVLAGTAEGNHVLLLSYYALLNLGVLGVAWSRGWRSVAVVGFVSTFLTGGLWGGLAYDPPLYATVQPFVVVSFAIYLALAVRFAVRSLTAAPSERALAVDGALVFGLPAATFVLQAGLIEGVVPYGRAWSAAVLAAVYLVGAGLVRRRDGLGLLADAFLGVGLAFATMALPLAFQRVVFGAIWVLEGAALVWVGVRQRKGWMRLGGLALQAVASLVLFAEGVLAPSSTFTAESLTGWIVAVGLGLSAYVLRDGVSGADPAEAVPEEAPGRSRRGDWSREERLASRLLLGFALFWWTTTAGVHVLDLAAERHVLAAMLGAAAASAALFLVVGRALGWSGLRAAAFGVVPAAIVLWLIALATETAPLAAWRWAGWLSVAAVTGWVLASERGHRLRGPAFVGAVWLGAGVVAWTLAWGAGRALGADWPLGAVGAVLVAALAASVRLPASVASGRERWASALGLAVAGVAWMVVSWQSRGAASPLPTIPILNPLGVPALGLLFALAALRASAPAPNRPAFSVLVGGLGLGALTVAVLRGVWASGIAPWDVDAMWASPTAQAGLAVAWTLLALGLAVWAVRRGSRPLWFFGAAVLGLVVAKLFLVDLSQAEALVRIAAFLIVGTLVLLIGYRAPLPPAEGGAAEPGAGE